MSAIAKNQIPAAALQGFEALFLRFLAEAPADYKSWANIYDSTNDSETKFWFSLLPGMRPWVGGRQVNRLEKFELTLDHQPYEDSFELDRYDVEDTNRWGLAADLIRQLADNTQAAPLDLIFSLLTGGFDATCYDGQLFFDTDHEEGDSGAQGNKGTSALTGGKTGTLATAISTMRNLRAGVVDPITGVARPLHVNPTHLIVGTENEWNAKEILQSTELIAVGVGNSAAVQGSANVLANRLQLVVDPRVNLNDWFLLDLSKAYKPFGFVWRQQPRFAGVDNPNDSYVFDTNKYKYGADARMGAGYQLWQLAYGAQVT